MSGAKENQEFLEHSRQRILNHARKRRDAGLTDKLYAVVRSESGNLYEGTPFETSMPQFDFCAERHAINNMLFAEPANPRVATILVATPVPDEATAPPTPCGACRHAIQQFSDDATVYCTTFVRNAEGWTMFPRIDQYTGAELYPDHQGHPDWE